MRVLVRSKASQYYNRVVMATLSDDGRKYNINGQQGLPNTTIVIANCVVLKVNKIGVNDMVYGLKTAGAAYYHSGHGFIGTVTHTGNKYITAKGRSVKNKKLMHFGGLDTKHFIIRKVHPDNVDAFIKAQGVVAPFFEALPLDEMEEKPAVRIAKVRPTLFPEEEPAKPAKPKIIDGYSVDTKVTLNEKSVYNDGSPLNPVKTKGEVVGFGKGKLSLLVKWSTGVTNSYSPADLNKG